MDKTTNFSIIINIQNVNFKIVSWRADYLKFHSFQRTIRNMNYSYRNVFGSFFCFLFRKELFLQDSVLNNCEFFPERMAGLDHAEKILIRKAVEVDFKK